MKAKATTKYEALHYLLGQYGTGAMDTVEFWRQMNARGYTQKCIDEWCQQYYKLEEENENRRKEAEDRAARAATARYAGGPGREEQAADRQERPRDRDGAAGQRQTTEGEDDQGRAVQEEGPQFKVINGQIWVRLPQAAIDYVDKKSDRLTAIAISRDADGENRDDQTRYASGRTGYRAEAAARLFFGRDVYWSIKEVRDLTKDKPPPDFSDFIDVKGRVQTHHQLYVKSEGFDPDRAYLLVCGARHPHYRIVGWCWGRDLATQDRWYSKRPDREPCWWIKEEDPIMRDPFELRELALAKVIG